MQFLIPILVGVGVGLVVGMLGAGGGILSVPILTFLLGQSPHAATSGSLVIVSVTAIVALPGKARRGQVRWREGLLFGLLSTLGAAAGKLLNSHISGSLLVGLFAVLLLGVAFYMFRDGFVHRRLENRLEAEKQQALKGTYHDQASANSTKEPNQTAETITPGDTGGVFSPGDELALEKSETESQQALAGESTQVASAKDKDNTRKGSADFTFGRFVAVFLAAALTGTLTGLFGVGGGFAVVPVLMLVLRLPVRQAAGTSLLVTLIASLASMGTGIVTNSFEVDWPTVLLFTVGSSLGGLMGGPLSQKARPSTLTYIFAVLLLAVSVYTLYTQF